MKQGYLIYEAWEAKKNERFIQMFQKAGELENITFSFVAKEEYSKMPLPDFVLNRTRDTKVSQWYEHKNIVVFHDSLITEIGNHKAKTLHFLEDHLPDAVKMKKWKPESVFLSKDQLIEWIDNFPSFGSNIFEAQKETEIVIKSVNGHGGSEVALLPVTIQKGQNLQEALSKQSGQDRQKLLAMLETYRGKEVLIQEKIASKSRDVRVYIVGNMIYQAVLRQGKEDFRSNFSLGGAVSAYSMNEEEKEWVNAFVKAFSKRTLGMAGIDFLIDEQERWIFNELEEMVGCRMLYQTTSKDIVKDYVRWIKRFV